MGGGGESDEESGTESAQVWTNITKRRDSSGAGMDVDAREAEVAATIVLGQDPCDGHAEMGEAGL